MTSRSAEHAELRKLIAALREGAITTEQALRLNQILSDSPSAIDFFARYSLLQSSLELAANVGSSCSVADLTAEQTSSAADRFSSSNSFSDILSPAIALNLASGDGHARRVREPFVGSPLFACMVATVVLAVMLLGAWLYKISIPEPPAVERSRSIATLDTPLPAIVGHVTGMHECRWADADTETFLGAPVRLDSKYSLDAGLLEITYSTGARVILEGRCEYAVESRVGGYLGVGKLIARVEAKGGESGNRGVGESGSRENRSGDSTPPAPLFAIRTPSAVVTDLGTKFGVIVGDDGDTATHVIEGRVELRVLDDDRPENQAIRIAAGESVHVERPAKDAENNLAAVARGKANAGLFPVSPNKSKAAVKDPRFEKFRRWQAFGEQLLKRDDLVAYYDFQPDRKDLSILRNRVPSSKHGRIENARWAPGRFLGKYALHYNNSKSVVHVDLSGLEGSRQLTFAAWVKCNEWPEKESCILITDFWRSQKPGAVAWLIDNQGIMSLYFHINNERQYAQIIATPSNFTSSPIEKGQWVMLAFSHDLDTQKSYCCYGEGRTMYGSSSSKVISDSLTFVGGPHSIGNWYDDKLNPLDVSLHGYIGELMVFRSALSPDEIDCLCRDSDPMDDDDLPKPPNLTPW